jgi:hypothetical protein
VNNQPTINIEFGPNAIAKLGGENLQLPATYPQGAGCPCLYDQMTFFVYGKDHLFSVIFRRWDMDENGNMNLTLGLELGD